jgi:uncharacterized protein (TIGR03084 family)
MWHDSDLMFEAGDIAEALAEQQAELGGLLDGLDEAGWAAGSRCTGWSVSDVVLHLAQTNEMAVGSFEDRYDEVLAGLTEGMAGAQSLDEGVDKMVAAQRGAPPHEVRARWDASVERLAKGLARGDAKRRVQWVVGTMAASTLATTRLAETWIHTGDIAFGLGVELRPADRLWHIARLAWRTIPYAFQREGRAAPRPVALHLTAPSGESWDFVPEGGRADTVIRGDGAELCLVAARRVDPADTGLTADGPDGQAVLALIRTWA